MRVQKLARFTFAGVCCALIALLFCTACDDSLQSLKDPMLQLTPEQFIFPKPELEQTIEREVAIENVGKGELKLAYIKGEFPETIEKNFELYWTRELDAGVNQYEGIFNGVNEFPNVISIDPDSKITFVLAFRATSEERPSGKITFQTNDPEHPDVSLPILSQSSGPEIYVSPRSIDFGRVPALQASTRQVTVSNLGQGTLTFQTIQIFGSSDFSLRHNNKAIDGSFLADPDQDGVEGLSSGQSFTLDVVYLSETEGSDAGELSFITNDALSPSYSVELKANGASPCINVPSKIDFGTTNIGRTVTRPLEIESCGGEPLEIRNIVLDAQSDTGFALKSDTLPQLPAALPAYTDEDRSAGFSAPSRTISVNFFPIEEGQFNGQVTIDCNDPLQSPNEDGSYRVSIPLSGRGTYNACPVAQVQQAEFEALPLDIITLDASGSTDPDGPNGLPLKYIWTVTSRPAGSTAQPVESFYNDIFPANGGPADDPYTSKAKFFVDLAGEYEIELLVEDAEGLQAPSQDCVQSPAKIHITAVPNQDIHIQLVWHTPDDEDETDGEGTDLDLHLRHPKAPRWNTALDCYYQSQNPDWGEQGNMNNPSLDIDDTNGAGPENINLNNPENTSELGGPYLVGVHYYRAEGEVIGAPSHGESIATVRIFLGGEMAYEGSRSLPTTNAFWITAAIHWTPSSHRVEVIDQLHSSVPND